MPWCKKFTNKILTGAVSNAMLEEVYQSDFNECSFQCDGGRRLPIRLESGQFPMRWCKTFTNQTLIGVVSNAMLEKVYESDFNGCSFQYDGGRR